MLDQDAINELKAALCDRYTPEELIEILGVNEETVFDRFLDEFLELDTEGLI